MQDFHRQDIAYAKIVDRYSRYIESPVLRLKFLNNALKVDHSRSMWNRIPIVGSLPDKAMIIVELSKVLPIDQPAPLGVRLTAILYRVRYAIYAMCAVFALLVGASLTYAVSRIVSSITISSEAKGV